MLLAMTKVQIIGTRRCLEPTVRHLHRLGVLQIEDLSTKPLPDVQTMTLDGAVLHEKGDVGLLLAQTEALVDLLSPFTASTPTTARLSPTAPVAEIRSQVGTLSTQAGELARQREDLETEQLSLPHYEVVIRKLVPLATGLGEYEAFETVALLIERRYRAVLDFIREELDRLTQSQFEMVSGDVDPETTAAILIFHHRYSAAVHALLGRQKVNEVRLPDNLARRSFPDALAFIAERQRIIPLDIHRINEHLQALASQWHYRLCAWRDNLRDRLDEIEIRSRFGRTRYTFLIVGWLPRRDVSRLRETLAREVGDEVFITEVPPSPHERETAPVVLSNPGVARPFEFLIRLLSLPRYGTLDPTLLMSFFLPLFFGMVLGDVAYGLIILALAIYMNRRLAPGGSRTLSQIMIPCALWSVVFGVLYGEYFGSFGEHFGLHPLWLDRAHAMTSLLIFTVAVGAVHVVLGLVLGVWAAIRERHRKELAEKAGTLLALLALFLLVTVTTNYLPPGFFTPGVAALVVGLVILMASLGPMGILLGPIELLGTVGNVLSYLRIAAIGLSSVYLAEVANEMAGLMGNVFLGVIVAGLFHALNIALGTLGSTIHPLRLHYVEFFTKFFQGGGQPFEPFQRASAKLGKEE